jgi:exodeoxyribonuclease-3
MRLISWNVNGVRAAVKKGFLDWLKHEQPDICCIQETKAHTDQLGPEILEDHGYKAYWHSGERRGYSGVATFCRQEPLFVQEGLGIEKCDQDTAFPIIFFYPQAFLDKERLLPAKGGHTTVAPALPRVPVGLIAVIL